ncbi:hypothetical protein GCM10012275_57730 [Longimycelium tulufanense]|uniref:Uncharacterized protein n=1 Tax=Longimycelium tulufanense TaxID=907463 RepID=A0A8J3FZE4_9PSEU|nr:hypothetical protein [Longimycelium tulufanense]GGM79529.1 hypothetical protein GCM10012275_57730 [Longimycelium tulufanense]
MWTYLHRVELYRIVRGARSLAWSEEYDDHGPWVCGGAVEYAATVAEDYLARHHCPAGRWLVIVRWLNPDAEPERTRLAKVEMTWPGANPVTEAAG